MQENFAFLGLTLIPSNLNHEKDSKALFWHWQWTLNSALYFLFTNIDARQEQGNFDWMVSSLTLSYDRIVSCFYKLSMYRINSKSHWSIWYFSGLLELIFRNENFYRCMPARTYYIIVELLSCKKSFKTVVRFYHINKTDNKRSVWRINFVAIIIKLV